MDWAGASYGVPEIVARPIHPHPEKCLGRRLMLGYQKSLPEQFILAQK